GQLHQLRQQLSGTANRRERRDVDPPAVELARAFLPRDLVGTNDLPPPYTAARRSVMTLSRREFIQGAAAMGATLAFAGPARASRATWRERRDLFPEGVASGDPDHQSVILWTRRPFEKGEREVLTVEVAEDQAFRHVVATAPAPVSGAADWTSRVLVVGLKPARTYWYRFTDADGNGSRVGRTITAPDPADGRAVSFTFVSCQSVN